MHTATAMPVTALSKFKLPKYVSVTAGAFADSPIVSRPLSFLVSSFFTSLTEVFSFFLVSVFFVFFLSTFAVTIEAGTLEIFALGAGVAAGVVVVLVVFELLLLLLEELELEWPEELEPLEDAVQVAVKVMSDVTV